MSTRTDWTTSDSPEAPRPQGFPSETVPFEDDDLDQDDEHKNLEEAVKRYEKAAGLLSVLALHMPFIREVMTFCWVASEYCTLFAFWNDEAQLIYMVKQVLSTVGGDPARLSKKHLLLPGLHDSLVVLRPNFSLSQQAN